MKFFIKTFGCRLNQSESQSVLERFESLRFEQTNDFTKARICVLNSCTVTAKADKDIKKLLKKISNENPDAKIAVTGCFADMHPVEIKKISPDVLIVKNKDKKNIFKILKLSDKTLDFTVKGHKEHSRAFIKVQDGCSQNCSYCIVSKARSTEFSKPIKKVLAEIKGILKNGYREIVLSGINIGNYKCPETGFDLAGLLDCCFTLYPRFRRDRFRIRLSSIEVKSITGKLIKTVKKGGDRFCNYFHIPLQSGSDKVLYQMNRNYDSGYYLKTIKKLRSNFKNPGIFADVIAGYPTETEKDFKQTVGFIEKVGFSGLHIFSYSKRPYTDAFKLKCLPSETVKRRSEILRNLDKLLRQKFAESLAGTIQKILVEKGCHCKPKAKQSVKVVSLYRTFSFNGSPFIRGQVLNSRLKASTRPAACSGVTAKVPLQAESEAISQKQAMGLTSNFQKVVIENAGSLKTGNIYKVKIISADNAS